jgi:hypothetical protein
MILGTQEPRGQLKCNYTPPEWVFAIILRPYCHPTLRERQAFIYRDPIGLFQHSRK